MNNRRVVGWLAFFGICGVIAWAPDHFFGEPSPDVADNAAPVSSKHRDAMAAKAQAQAAGAGQASNAAVPQVDLFASQNWYVAPVMTAEQVAAMTAAAAPAVPTVPTAPPLPFQFVGKMSDSQQSQVFLQNGERLYVVRSGDVIDQTYKVGQITATEMSLVYLPLHLAQTLSVGSAP
jgi:hypothetical protein